MSESVENLIVEPILEDMVLVKDGQGVLKFLARSGYELPAEIDQNAYYIFRPLHKGDFAAGLMYDARGRKLESGYGYYVVSDLILIDAQVQFPLEFAYIQEVQIENLGQHTWPLPGTLPGQGGQGWAPTIIGPGTGPGSQNPNGGSWGVLQPSWTITSGTQGAVYYGYNHANGVAQQSATIGGMSATYNASNGPQTIADFAAIRTSGSTVTGL